MEACLPMTDPNESRLSDSCALAETAVRLWEDLTGVKVGANSFSISMGQEFSIYSAIQEIRKA